MRLEFVVLFLVLALVTSGWAQTKSAPTKSAQTTEIDIPYERFVLDNGLTVIVHEDHKAPIVALNIWYHVGSKNEKSGKTGFAHLFEHLMLAEALPDRMEMTLYLIPPAGLLRTMARGGERPSD